MGYNLPCPVCDQQTITSVQDLQLKMATALSTALGCPICNSSLNGMSNLHSHISSHLSGNFSESSKETVLTPMDQIPSIENLEIEDENQELELNLSSINHNCNLCGLVFSSEYFLNIHKGIIHSNSDVFEISCKLCKSKFKNLDKYRQHVTEVHSGERYFCQQCPKSFKMKGGLLVHTRMFHDQNSPNYCTICKKSFTTKTRREIHMNKCHSMKESINAPCVSSTLTTNTLGNNNLNLIEIMTKKCSTIPTLSEHIQVVNQQGTTFNSPQQQNNFNMSFPEEHHSDRHGTKLLSTAIGSPNEVSGKGNNITNSAFLNIQHEVTQNVYVPSVPITITDERHATNILPNEATVNYNKLYLPMDSSAFNEKNISTPNSILDVNIPHKCDSIFDKVVNSSFNSTPLMPTENEKTDASNLLELFLWSNCANSPTNTNFNILLEKKLQSQSERPPSIAFRNKDVDSAEASPSEFESKMETEPCLSSEHKMNSNQVQFSDPGYSLNMKDESPKNNDNKTWQCDECMKSFTTKYFLKKHRRLHTGETPYSCVECGKTFTFQQSYHKHLFYHTNDKPHQCPQCGRSFKEMSTLHNHIRIHTGEKPFICSSCGKSFRQRVSYLVHQRIHTGIMPYNCEKCKKSFRYKVSLRSHKCPDAPDPLQASDDMSANEAAFYNNIENLKCTSLDTQVNVNRTFMEALDSASQLANSSTVSPSVCIPQTEPMSTDFDKDLFIHSLFS